MTPTPLEPPEEGPETDDSGNATSGSEPSLRGWIDPDDRLWRHPQRGGEGCRPRRGHRLAGIRHPRTMILIGAAATLGRHRVGDGPDLPGLRSAHGDHRQ